MNEQIHLSPVRLVGADGEQVGIVPLDDARKAAAEAGLDLVEVAPNARPIVVRIMDWGKHRLPNARPIVVRIMDWGKHRFETNKKAREARKKETRINVKQVKLRPSIDEHDLTTKLNHARRFLADGDKVKIVIMFRGRDLRRPENGRKLLDRVIELLKETAIIESAPGGIINRDMSMVLAPRRS